ncbi:class I SAM-dependent methyltransferase [uncultured Maricaulis sp.]|uniref:class I SAM-dependent methyltransferase n=1 Tax=uncultured Maricaulis sp. TaxID=174710 RepID=UPI0030DA7684|tara:strand:- start:4803 stop:5585 length:783 start_codon:yes stop_codon:yes gene_type:complete
MDIHRHNASAWNTESDRGDSPWCQPVSADVIAAARRGEWSVILTPNKSVPRDWFGPLQGARVLCLAGSGGQQAPVLAAAGADVTVLDISAAQLAKDVFVAQRDGLDLTVTEADMTRLSEHVSGGFDLIFHPTSNLFIADLAPVWRQCAEVLKPGGRLLSGFVNPDFWLFDHAAVEGGAALQVRYKLPFNAARDLPEAQVQARIEQREALEFSHSLESQIGGQIEAGLLIAGFYQDDWSDEATPLNAYMPTSFATLALKPG